MNRVQEKITFRVVRETLGVNEHFEAITEDDYRELLNLWKTQVVIARQSGDAERETKLNNCKAWIIKEMRESNDSKCPRCGQAKSKTSKLCGVCNQSVRAGMSQVNNVSQPTKNMNFQEIIQTLEREKSEQEKLCAVAQARVSQLTVAIDALSGRQQISTDTKESKSGPSVPEMVKEAAQRLTAATPDAIFDHETLVNEASQLYPDRHSLIKRGIYVAVDQLKKRNVLKLAPGGFQLI